MKCPKCELVVSDSKDSCPRCGLELRSLKERCGIKETSLSQAKKAAIPSSPQQTPSPETTLEHNTEAAEASSGWFKKIFGKKDAAFAADAGQNKEAYEEQTPYSLQDEEFLLGNSDEAAAEDDHQEPWQENSPELFDEYLKEDFETLSEPTVSTREEASDIEDSLFAALEEHSDGLDPQSQQPGLSQDDFADLVQALEDMQPEEILQAQTDQTEKELADEELHELMEALQTIEPEKTQDCQAAPLSQTHGEEPGELSDLLEMLNSDEPEPGNLDSPDFSADTTAQQSEHLLENEEDLTAGLLASALLEDDEAAKQPTENNSEDLEDPLQMLSQSLESGIDEAKVAADSLQHGQFSLEDELLSLEKSLDELPSEDLEEQKEEDDDTPTLATPAVAPEVMEFSDDDELLEQKLDEMLGDTILDVKAVKTEKPKASKPTQDETSFTVDDMEISFEIDIDDEPNGESSVQALAEASPAPDLSETDSEILQGLLETFHQLSGETQYQPIAPASEERPTVFEPAPEEPSPETGDDNLPEPLARISAIEQQAGSEKEVIRELKILLAKAYEVNPDLLLKEDDPLKLLEKELDQQLRELSLEGTTFLSTISQEAAPDPVTPAPREALASEEPLDEELLKLEQELNGELEALQAEGTTIFSEEADITQETPVEASLDSEPSEQLDHSQEYSQYNEPEAELEDSFEASEEELSSELDSLLAEQSEEGEQEPTAEFSAPEQDSPQLAEAEEDFSEELNDLLSEVDSLEQSLEEADITQETPVEASLESEPSEQLDHSQESSGYHEPETELEDSFEASEEELSSELDSLLTEQSEEAEQEPTAEFSTPEQDSPQLAEAEEDFSEELGDIISEVDSMEPSLEETDEDFSEELDDLLSEVNSLEQSLEEADITQDNTLKVFEHTQEEATPETHYQAELDEEDIRESLEENLLLEMQSLEESPEVENSEEKTEEAALQPNELEAAQSLFETALSRLLVDENQVVQDTQHEEEAQTEVELPQTEEASEPKEEFEPTQTERFLAVDLQNLEEHTEDAPAEEELESTRTEQFLAVDLQHTEEHLEEYSEERSQEEETSQEKVEEEKELEEAALDISSALEAFVGTHPQEEEPQEEPEEFEDASSALLEEGKQLEDELQNQPQPLTTAPELADPTLTSEFLVSDIEKIIVREALEKEEEPYLPGEMQSQETQTEEEDKDDDSEDNDSSSSGKHSNDDTIELGQLLDAFADEQGLSPEFEATQTGAFLAEDIARLIKEPTEEKSEEPQHEAAAPETTDTESLWTAAEEELSAWQGNQNSEIEIGVNEICRFEKNDSTMLLFEVAEEELSEPEGSRYRVTAMPTSETRQLDSTKLEKAVLEFHRDRKIAKERKKEIEQIRKEESLRPVYGETAPIWRRLGAMALDFLAAAAAGAAFTWFLSLPEWSKAALLGGEIPAPSELLLWGFDLVLFVYAASLTLSCIMVASTGQTLGGKLFGIEVLTLKARPLGFAQSLLRALSHTATMLSCGLGLLPLLGKKKQTLHDRLAKTQVARVTFETMSIEALSE